MPRQRSPEQSPRARALIDSHEVLISTTVLLETEWVLRSAYGYPPPQVSEALRALAGLPRVTLEDPALAATAPDWMAAPPFSALIGGSRRSPSD